MTDPDSTHPASGPLARGPVVTVQFGGRLRAAVPVGRLSREDDGIL